MTLNLTLLLSLLLCSLPLQALEQQVNPLVPEINGKINLSVGSTSPTLQAQQPDLPKRPRSGRRKPASARGPCSPSETSITALIPANNLGLTTKAYPTFFFYIPLTPATTMEFVLIDEENQRQIYTTTLTLTGHPGIVSFSLPDTENVPPLELEKEYHWYASLICNHQQRSGDIYVDGWIQRVAPDPLLMSQLENTSLTEQITIYQESGLWYDTLKALAEAHRLYPDNSTLVARWTTLLKSVGLDDIADESPWRIEN
ncbi:MAG: DUF928 domain-containing protein [Symploca sp. SIO2E6]|nr:DUF928 domain-containing protein [Symploca sp. SIO2E6]